MRRAWPLLLLLLPACDATFCEADRLATPTGTPRWVVRFHDQLDFEPPMEIPGQETFFDPPGSETYTSYSLYDDTGAVVAERWIDTLTSWESATATPSAADRMPSIAPADELTLLLANGRRSSVSFALTDGEVLTETPGYGVPPDVSGQLWDELRVSERLAIATRRRHEGGGGDLVLFDPIDRVTLRTLDVSRLSSGRVEPGRIARLDADRLVIGLTLLDEPSRGAVALVELSTEAVSRLEVQGLEGCNEVASRDTAGEVAVLCRGDVLQAPEERAGVGLAVIVTTEEIPGVELRRVGDATLARWVPTGRLVPLADGWVAVLSRGDPLGRDDALVAIDLDGEGVEVLRQERHDDRFGEGLGGGDFGGGELWWPSVFGGVLRWRQEGDTFTSLEPADVPVCETTPAREIRYLRAP